MHLKFMQDVGSSWRWDGGIQLYGKTSLGTIPRSSEEPPSALQPFFCRGLLLWSSKCWPHQHSSSTGLGYLSVFPYQEAFPQLFSCSSSVFWDSPLTCSSNLPGLWGLEVEVAKLEFPSLYFPPPLSQHRNPETWQWGRSHPRQQLQCALSFWGSKPGQGHHELFSSECNNLIVF